MKKKHEVDCTDQNQFQKKLTTQTMTPLAKELLTKYAQSLLLLFLYLIPKIVFINLNFKEI